MGSLSLAPSWCLNYAFHFKISVGKEDFENTQMKHTLGIRDQKGWNRCPEWGPGTKVGVPEKGKNQKLF